MIVANLDERGQRKGARLRPRAHTVPIKKITKTLLRQERELYPEAATLRRPRNRSECAAGPRPCPWVGCLYHLFLDVHPATGSIKFNHPDFEPWEMPVSCALDIACVGDNTLEQVAAAMNTTRERIRQIEEATLRRLLLAKHAGTRDAEQAAALAALVELDLED
jgi:hypothetical protein